MRSQVIKSSVADAPRDRVVPAKAQVATSRLVVKLVHVVLDEHPEFVATEHLGDLVEAVKWKIAQLDLRLTESRMGESGRISAAVDRALFQRRYVATGGAPAWKAPWEAKQRAERDRRRRGMR